VFILCCHYAFVCFFVRYTPCPKISGTLVSNTPNSVCSSWISTKYRTLHYLDISYRHTHYDIRALPCVLSVMSLYRQSLFTLGLRYVQCIVIDKGIKQQCIRFWLRVCVEAKGSHFKLKLQRQVQNNCLSDWLKFCLKNLSGINDFTLTYL